MALNFDFLGLGVNFNAKDQGLNREQGLVARGFTAIHDSLATIGEVSPFEHLAAGFQQMTDHVAAVIGQVRGLTEGVNLTTAYEAHMQALGVEARRTGANMGYAGAQLNQFTSRAAGLADGLNTSATTAAEAIDALARGGEGLRAVGLRTQADAVRFQASFGGLQELSAGIHQLRTEYELTDDQVRRVIGSTTAMGRATGNVSAAFSGLGDVLGALRQRASLQGSTLDAEELAASAAQVQSLSAGFYSMTHNADEARRMALDVFQSQLGAQQNWSNMFAGTEDDVGDFVTHMSIAQGDVNHAFEQMRQGPADFVRGIVQMYQTAKRSGPVTAEQFNFLRGQLERALGPQSAQMMADFMRTADDSTLSMMATVENGTADLGRMAREAHRTGRTLQQEFDRIKDIGTASFRSIGRHEAVQMVQDTAAAFHRFNDQMRDVVARGGPMGEFVEKLSAIHQIGALALIPRSLRPMAVLFGHLTDQLIPLVTALGAMGFRMGALLNPYTLVIAAVGFLVLNFFDLFVQTGSLSDAFDKLVDRVVNFGRTAWDMVSRYGNILLDMLERWSGGAAEWANTFNWTEFFTTWINRGLRAAMGVGALLREIGNEVFSELGRIFHGEGAKTRIGRVFQNMGEVAQAMFRGLMGSLRHLDWSAVGHLALTALFDSILGPVLGTVAMTMPWERLGEVMSSGMTEAMSSMQGGGLGDWLDETFAQAVTAVQDLWPQLLETIAHYGSMLPGLLSEGMDIGSGLLQQLFEALSEVVDRVRFWFDSHHDEIVAGIGELGGAIIEGVVALIVIAVNAVWEWIQHLPDLYGTLSDLVESVANAAISLMGTLAEGMVDAVRRALVHIFPEYEDTINSVMGGIRNFYREFYDIFVRGIVRDVFEQFRSGLRFIQELFRELNVVASETARFIQDPWQYLVDWFVNTWNQIDARVRDVFNGVVQSFQNLDRDINAGVARVVNYFRGAGDEISDFFGGAITGLSQRWESFKESVRSGIESVSRLLRSIFGGGGEVEAASQQSSAATEVVAAQARGVVQDTSRAVSGGIISGLVGAFRSGFDTVMRSLGGFKDRFVELFGRFTDTLREKINAAMTAVRDSVDSAIAGIGSSLSQLSNRFQALISTATTLAALSAATAGPASGVAGPAGTGTIRPLDHATTQEDVRQAIHDPAWYRNYVQVFDGRMRELIAAVERNGRGAAPPARRGDSGGAAASQQRAEEGIQTGR